MLIAIFAFLSGGHGTLSMQGHAVQITSTASPDHAVAGGHDAHAMASRAIDCPGPVFAGCRMHLCHPALSSDPLVIHAVAGACSATALRVVQHRGIGPSIILPPPRPLAV